MKKTCYYLLHHLPVLFLCIGLITNLGVVKAQTETQGDQQPPAASANPPANNSPIDSGTTEGGTATYNPCDNLPSEGRAKCNQCIYGGSSGGTGEQKIVGFWSAIGCIPTNPMAATRGLLNFMLGVGGFFVVVQILIGSFQLLTSRGNTQALQDARERITNSVIALLFIVFSVTIIEFIGVRVLHLPGFFDG